MLNLNLNIVGAGGRSNIGAGPDIGPTTTTTTTTTSTTTTSTTTSAIAGITYLVVAGGGGSGGNSGGGGGAGGYLSGSVNLSAATYLVTVGAGGPAGFGNAGGQGNGYDSAFYTSTGSGGGFGYGLLDQQRSSGTPRGTVPATDCDGASQKGACSPLGGGRLPDRSQPRWPGTDLRIDAGATKLPRA